MGLTPMDIAAFRSRNARECQNPGNPFYCCFFEFIGPNDELSEVPFPKYVYRYFDKREYAEDLAGKGTLRLGALLKYTNAEEYEGARHDEAEGRAGFLSKVVGGKFDGMPYQYTVISQDCWILCTSTEFSKEVAKRFNSDWCVRITFRPFALALARAMAPFSDVGGAGFIRYSTYAGAQNIVSTDRARTPFSRMHKRRNYSSEKEIRIWFEPRKHRDLNRRIEMFGRDPCDPPTNVDYIHLTSKELPRFCKFVSLH